MTMDAIPTDQLRKNLSSAAKAVVRERERDKTRITELQGEIDEIHVGARAAERAVLDEAEVVLERQRQYDWVIGDRGNEASAGEADVDELTPEPAPNADAAPEPEPVPEPTAEQPAVPQRRNHADPRSWKGLAWVLAVAGAVIGFIVGSTTSGFDNFHGAGHGWFTFGWVVVCIGTGLFVGGYIGSLIEEYKERRNTGNNQ